MVDKEINPLWVDHIKKIKMQNKPVLVGLIKIYLPKLKLLCKKNFSLGTKMKTFILLLHLLSVY